MKATRGTIVPPSLPVSGYIIELEVKDGLALASLLAATPTDSHHVDIATRLLSALNASERQPE